MVVSLSALMTSVTSHLCDLMLTKQAGKPHVKSQALDCIDAARKLVSNINPSSAKRRGGSQDSSLEDPNLEAKKLKIGSSSECKQSSGGVTDEDSSRQLTESRPGMSRQSSSAEGSSHHGVPVVNKPGSILDSRQKLSDLLEAQRASMMPQVPQHNSRGKTEAYIYNKNRQFQRSMSTDC